MALKVIKTIARDRSKDPSTPEEVLRARAAELQAASLAAAALAEKEEAEAAAAKKAAEEAAAAAASAEVATS